MKISTAKRRLAYLSGPVDALEVYRAWDKEGSLDYFGTSYLKQFYQACKDYNAEGYVITTMAGAFSRHRAGSIVIENRPQPSGLSGLPYHIAQCIWLIKMLPSIIRFQPDVLILTAAYNYWLVLYPLKLFGIILIPVVHDSLWKRFTPLTRAGHVLRRFCGAFLAGCVREMMVAADTTAAQVHALLPKTPPHIETFLPTYSHNQFASISPSNFDDRPFRVLFMGRIEINKGIYDLLRMASRLRTLDCHFDVCGDGSQLRDLRNKVIEQRLEDRFVCHGFVDRRTVCSLMDRAHVVIVPTTTDFEEGFNMVCAEAILSGRPVITSAVCPALGYIREAAIEVTPNDIDGYCNAIQTLATSPNVYEQKRAACKRLQPQFYDQNNSWSAKLRLLLARNGIYPTIEKTQIDTPLCRPS